MTTLLLLALGALTLYVAACAFWPYSSCRNCLGTGKWRSPSRKAWRPCRRCDGTGRRLRLGRRVYELMRGNDQ